MTAFDPGVHGFAFTNSWQLDLAEQQRLPAYFLTHVARRRMGGALGSRLAPSLVWSLRGRLAASLMPVYGLCGGMCFTALDFYYRPDRSFPRDQHMASPPAAGTRLRAYIWQRQLDSLSSDAPRFVSWLARLNYIPATRLLPSGPTWLLERSKAEWKYLKVWLDAGRPTPLGLVRASRKLYDNHQVIAIGYDQPDQTHATLYVYDPNCPGVRSSISLEWGARQLEGQEGCCPGAPLRGFFCETYDPLDPLAALD